MGRKPEFNLVGVLQHVIQRGNNREPCFYAEEDYSAYLKFLKIACEKAGCQIHAYILMTNHVHMFDNADAGLWYIRIDAISR